MSSENAAAATASEWQDEVCPHCAARGQSMYRRVHPRLGSQCFNCDKRSPYRTLAEILENPQTLEPPETVVPRLAWRGRVTLLAAREKDGKSTLASAAAAAVTRGTKFLDGVALDGAVVLASLEEHVGETASRLVRFNANSDRIHIATCSLSDPLTELKERIEQKRPVLVIGDTLSALAEGKLEDGSAKAWQPLMAALTKLARDFNCAVLILHHARKSDGTYRDSTAIGANVDCIIEMRPDDRDSAVRHLKARARFPVPECRIRFSGSGYELAETVEPEEALRSAVKRYVNEHPGCSLYELRQGVHVGSYQAKGTIATELVADGVLREERGPRGARRFYSAAPPLRHVPQPVPVNATGNVI